MTHSQRCSSPFCLFRTRSLIAADRTGGKKKSKAIEGKHRVSFRNLEMVLACFGKERYCHMLQVHTNEKEFFQLCLLLLESDTVKHARFHCQEQTVIKATAVVASEIQKIPSDEETHFQDEVKLHKRCPQILRAAPCLPSILCALLFPSASHASHPPSPHVLSCWKMNSSTL